MERWISEKRRRVCVICPRLAACHAAGIIHSIFAPETACPEGKHLSRAAQIAARAWPDGADTISGCCDRADQH